jgi:hypothetical protein
MNKYYRSRHGSTVESDFLCLAVKKWAVAPVNFLSTFATEKGAKPKKALPLINKYILP